MKDKLAVPAILALVGSTAQAAMVPATTELNVPTITDQVVAEGSAMENADMLVDVRSIRDTINDVFSGNESDEANDGRGADEGNDDGDEGNHGGDEGNDGGDEGGDGGDEGNDGGDEGGHGGDEGNDGGDEGSDGGDEGNDGGDEGGDSDGGEGGHGGDEGGD